MILAGDIGGTNTRLALFDEQLNKLYDRNFRNEGRGGLTEIVREFIGGVGGVGAKPGASAPGPSVAGAARAGDAGGGADAGQKIDRATFGVAGPVKEGRASMTNLPWKLDERELARELKIDKVALINDLVAHGEGIELLRPEHLVVVQQGEVVHGNRAVIAAGTGLGEGGIFWDAQPGGQGGQGGPGGRGPGGRYRAFASEGGHCDFAPRDERQIALLKFLHAKYPNASWERVLSGPGLRNIYDFLITPEQLGPGTALAATEQGPQARQGGPKPSKISEAGMRGSNRACVEALDLFVAFYGAEAANLALKVMATGGVYIGGGIAPNIIAKLKSPTFRDAFLATGPPNIRQVLAKIPIHVVTFELNGLYGAANFAAHL